MSTLPPPQPNPYAASPASTTNTLAIVSLVLSIAGLFTFVTAIGGVVCGHIALGQTRRTGEEGQGFALGGIITGYVVIGLYVLGLILGAIILIVSLNLVTTLVQSGVTEVPRP